MTKLARARQEVSVVGLPRPISHYADAVRFGDLLFVSGLTAHDEHGLLTSEDTAGQARQIFRNLGRVLDTVGALPADVLKVTVYLTDIGDRTRINPERQAFFGDARPASTLVGVAALALPGMKVEIEAVVGLRG